MAPATVTPAKPAKTDLEHNTMVFSGLLIHTVLIGLLPITLFMMSQKGYFDEVYRYTIGIPDPDRRGVISTLLAVFGVNIVVASFVIRAFREEDAVSVDQKKND